MSIGCVMIRDAAAAKVGANTLSKSPFDYHQYIFTTGSLLSSKEYSWKVALMESKIIT